jgi:6-phosphofructokinase 2
VSSGALAGKNITEESQIKAEAGKMVDTAVTARCWSSRCGAAGALMVTKDSSLHIRPPAVPIISKVGAGDSMVAGTVLSLARGKSLKESVMFGVAAGTAAVMTPGTQLCRKEDTERLFETMISES